MRMISNSSEFRVCFLERLRTSYRKVLKFFNISECFENLPLLCFFFWRCVKEYFSSHSILLVSRKFKFERGFLKCLTGIRKKTRILGLIVSKCSRNSMFLSLNDLKSDNESFKECPRIFKSFAIVSSLLAPMKS